MKIKGVVKENTSDWPGGGKEKKENLLLPSRKKKKKKNLFVSKPGRVLITLRACKLRPRADTKNYGSWYRCFNNFSPKLVFKKYHSRYRVTNDFNSKPIEDLKLQILVINLKQGIKITHEGEKRGKCRHEGTI